MNEAQQIDLPITVRRMEFEFPTSEEFDPLWAGGSPTVSYFTLGLSLYLPYLEPYIIKALRSATHLVKSDDVLDKIDKFCRQEAQHYKQHEKFNALIHERDYPGLAEIEARCKAEFDDWLENKPLKYNVGFVEGFESYTTQGAVASLNGGALSGPNVDQKIADLFRWHLTEEIEHRTVAFDVWEHIYGDYVYRVKMCWIAQWHVLRFILRCLNLMSRVDRLRHGPQYRVPAYMKTAAVAAALYQFAITYMPNYSPHNMKISPAITELAERYTKKAESAQV
jgi:predicted metal-dependent hydrolase